MGGFYDAPLVLTDAGLETTIVYEYGRPLRNFAACELLNDGDGRAILTKIYRSYVDVAQRYGLPIQIGTPTWRASGHWIENVERINREAVQFLREIVSAAKIPVAIAGEVGPSSDGYAAGKGLSLEDAVEYHREQVAVLADAGVDLLYAPTFPEIAELHGVARAMGETKTPFAVAPMLHSDGTMIDGTPLAAAIETLDDDPSSRPWHYMLGCIYPTKAETALEALFRTSPAKAHRVIGLKANGSPLSLEELDRSNRLERTSSDRFAEDLWASAGRFGLHVLGGCCGTDAAYLAAIAQHARARA